MPTHIPYTHTQKANLEEIPFEEREWDGTPFHTLQAAIQGREQENGMQFFLTPSGYKKAHSFSYHDLIAGMAQTAQLLSGLGLGSSDRIALILPHIPELHMVLWGGSLVCPVGLIDPMMSIEQMTASLQHLKPKVLITLGPYPGLDLWDRIEEVREEISSIRFVLQIDLVAYLGKIKQWQARRILRSRGKAEPIEGQQIGDFNASRQKFPYALPASFSLADSQDDALILITGKDTETFAIQAYSHRQICATLWGLQQVLPRSMEGSYLWGESCDSLSACLVDGLLPMLDGQTIVCAGPQGFSSEILRQDLGEISAFFHVQRMRIGLGSLLSLPDSQDPNLAQEWILMEGWGSNSIMPEESSRRYWQIHQTPRGQALGVSSLQRDKSRHLPPLLPYLYGKAVSLADNQLSLQFSGPLLGKMIHESVNHHAILITEEENEWIDQGDSSSQLTHKGYVFFVREVEQSLNHHPAVRASILVGRADEDAGEVPIAYIQLWPDTTAGPKDIYEFVLERLPEQRMIPQGIRIVDTLPRQHNGNIHRQALSDQENAS